MNNGKVRIYELSKELNLDNKDLLAVCEQLDISVKSHSSTITDSEAERIRAAAEKYVASHPAQKSAPARQGSQSQADSMRKPAPVQKKQQILEIRSKPIIRQPTSPEPPAASNGSAQVANFSQAQVAAKPAALNRPGHASALDTPDVEESVLEPESTVLPQVEVLPEPSAPEVPQDLQSSAEALQVESTPAPQSELSGPPPRPSATVMRTPMPANPNRPVLKRAAGAPAARADGARPSERAGAAGKPAGSRQPGGKPVEDRAPARPPTIVELRRPKPAQSEFSGGISSRGGGDLASVEAPVLKINRPKPGAPGSGAPGDTVQLQTKPVLPKLGSKKRGRHDEEEEVVEFPEKAKVGPKNKRRSEVDDEDEDLELLLDEDELDPDEDSPVQVSLSLVRPAKPKSSKSTQPKPPQAAAPKPKRQGSFRDRRDRRDQDTKIEKPELITLTGSVTVQELSALLMTPETDIIRALFFKGIAATITQTLDVATATMVAEELGILVEAGEKESEARKVTEMLDADDLDNLQRRPPVVTIMGHVDHGKTTLLDSIRRAKVAQGEAGGITQHIGAYHVEVDHNGKKQPVVFLDTPGHEAFTAMRARGARVTDIAILVVAADDGVRPQTIEAISHAKAAGVPIIVAINKIDKEQAQPDRVKQELTEHGLVAEDWGGDTIMVPVSAITGDNLDTLLEMILLVAEIEDMHANPDRLARGTVIEAHLDKAKGAVATLIIQNGTLRVGDIIVAGSSLGKVRALMDDRGARVKAALPSFAVEVLGLNDVPAAGDEFQVFGDEKEARAIAEAKQDQQRQSRLMAAMSSRRVSLNTLSVRAQEGDLKELNLVLKADVQGSVEAILGALKQLPQKEVQVRVLFAAPGEISETDVDLAAASSAVIIGFNTTLAPGARQAADRSGVDVRDYNIIYNLLDDIQAAMEGLLDPEMVEESLGQVEVRAVFPVGRGAVAGCYVLSGKIIRNSRIRVRRGNAMVFDGNLDSLKRMKEDTREVNAGYECGIGVDNFNGWVLGDVIEVFRMISKRRTLSK
jgi:translation initiation factor IF-2